MAADHSIPAPATSDAKALDMPSTPRDLDAIAVDLQRVEALVDVARAAAVGGEVSHETIAAVLLDALAGLRGARADLEGVWRERPGTSTH